MGDVDGLCKQFQLLLGQVGDMPRVNDNLNATVNKLNTANHNLNQSLANLATQHESVNKPDVTQQLTPAAIAEIVEQAMSASNVNNYVSTGQRDLN
jgi:hypothetical protein